MRSLNSWYLRLMNLAQLSDSDLWNVTKTLVSEERKVTTLEDLEKLRSLLSHQNPEGTNGKLLELLIKMALEKLDPDKSIARF